MCPTTLDLQRKQIHKFFVGREAESALFNHLIGPAEPAMQIQPNVLLIEGEGGIGKTWLLHHLRREADQRGDVWASELIDLYSITTRQIEGLEREIIIAVSDDDEGWNGPRAQELFPRYHQALAFLADSAVRKVKISEEMKIRQRLDGLAQDLNALSQNRRVVLFLDTFEKVRHDPVGGWLLNELPRDADACMFVIAGRPETEAVIAPGGESDSGTTAFRRQVEVLKLNGLSSEEQQVYLDNRNVKTTNARRAILRVGEAARGSPLLLELAIEWLGREMMQQPEVFDRRLEDARNEAQKKAESIGDATPEKITEAREKATLAAVKKILMEPLRSLGGRLFGVSHVDQALFETLLLMAFFNRRFHAQLLALLEERGFVNLAGRSAAEMLEKLGEMFFVKYRHQDQVYQIQDEMEQMLLDFVWPERDPLQTTRQKLSKLALDWYDDQIRAASKDPVERGALIAERLFYSCFLDPHQAWSEFNQLYDGYYKGREDDDDTPLSVIEMAASEMLPSLKHLNSVEQMDTLLQFIRLNYTLNEFSNVEYFARKLIDIAGIIKEPLYEVFGHLHLYSSRWRNNPDGALVNLRDAYSLADTNRLRWIKPRLLYMQGFALRNMWKLKDALGKFEECVDAAIQQHDRFHLASALNDMGYVNAVLGDFERADACVKEAREIRTILVKKAAEGPSPKIAYSDQRQATINLIWSYNTQAEVYRYQGQLSEAEDFYLQAFNKFQEIDNFEGMAIALMARCDTLRRIALAKEARGEEEDAAKLWEEAEENILKSLDLFSQYKLQRGLDTVHRRYGRYLRDRFKTSALDEAQEQFEQGLRIARKNKANLEILENLMELAFLAAERNDQEHMEKYIDQTQKQDLRNSVDHYEVFPLLAELARGNCYMRQNPPDYDHALQAYLKGYTGLAGMLGYGSALYISHRHRLFSTIEQLNEPLKYRWMKAFLDAWKKNKLENRHKDMNERFQLKLKLLESYYGDLAGGKV